MEDARIMMSFFFMCKRGRGFRNSFNVCLLGVGRVYVV
jgi:hypothetical protein